MTIPDGVFYEGSLKASDLRADRQQGHTNLSAEDFAAALLAANPDWTGPAEVPAADDEGVVAFDVTAPDRRTIAVRFVPTDNSATGTDLVISDWTIDYG